LRKFMKYNKNFKKQNHTQHTEKVASVKQNISWHNRDYVHWWWVSTTVDVLFKFNVHVFQISSKQSLLN